MDIWSGSKQILVPSSYFVHRSFPRALKLLCGGSSADEVPN